MIVAWARCCGGGGATPTESLLAPLNTLGATTTKWIKNTYVNGLANTGAVDSNYGYLVSVDSNNVATLYYTGGYSVGFVTECRANRTYRITTSGTRVSLAILFCNGATIVSITQSSKSTITFTVPNNISDVVLLPYAGATGTFTFAITEFVDITYEKPRSYLYNYGQWIVPYENPGSYYYTGISTAGATIGGSSFTLTGHGTVFKAIGLQNTINFDNISELKITMKNNVSGTARVWVYLANQKEVSQQQYIEVNVSNSTYEEYTLDVAQFAGNRYLAICLPTSGGPIIEISSICTA